MGGAELDSTQPLHLLAAASAGQVQAPTSNPRRVEGAETPTHQPVAKRSNLYHYSHLGYMYRSSDLPLCLERGPGTLSVRSYLTSTLHSASIDSNEVQMDTPTDFKIKLTGPGMVIDRPISAEIAQRIAFLLFTDGKLEAPMQPMGHQITATTTVEKTAAGQPTNITPAPAQSLREFLTACDPVRIPEKIATIGYYIEKHGNPAGFTKQDIIKGFEQSKEPIPKNLARDITWTLKIGWIAPKHENEDIYYVTKSGVEAVESKFPAEIRKKTKASEGGRKRKAQGKSPAKKP
jgi:hypothetical protein